MQIRHAMAEIRPLCLIRITNTTIALCFSPMEVICRKWLLWISPWKLPSFCCGSGVEMEVEKQLPWQP